MTVAIALFFCFLVIYFIIDVVAAVRSGRLRRAIEDHRSGSVVEESEDDLPPDIRNNTPMSDPYNFDKVGSGN